ncbi:hypothetical protein Kirov_174 [Bacillus phage Kirov]|uniref:Uncharacterized protein n=1 Tax=Bacillus phage Kirov TaxID=2783539 RepID=A0A7U3NJX5_9CAUD|nr:hypothetical protein PQE67_gp130 [Bacillus phage Kirov]QOV08373.1 hypothetical protein Kirov_174 [Bacillus phage Kirov]
MVANSIEGFIKSLDLPQESTVLFQTIGDCHSFYITNYGRNACVADDILDYRETKLEESDITLELFVDMCSTKGIKTAFQNTFLQVFDEEDVGVINWSLLSGRATLESIYSQFKMNPNKNILSYVL